MKQKRPYCLTVAGFDPSGGAGLVADCKTFEQLGVNGLSVLTANTLQTEDEYREEYWISDEIIVAQLELLLKRYPVRFVKIGLVKDASTLLRILKTIRIHSPKAFILWDPVLRASAGGELDEQRFYNHLTEILSLISGIIPNIPEFQQLFGENTPESVAEKLSFFYLKGGHATQLGKDVVFSGGKKHPLNPRIQTNNDKHGTGCVLSAALVAHLALDYPVVKACLRSKRYVERFIVSNATLLGYHSR